MVLLRPSASEAESSKPKMPELNDFTTAIEPTADATGRFTLGANVTEPLAPVLTPRILRSIPLFQSLPHEVLPLRPTPNFTPNSRDKVSDASTIRASTIT